MSGIKDDARKLDLSLLPHGSVARAAVCPVQLALSWPSCDEDVARLMRMALTVALPSANPDELLADVLSFGAAKYARDNWRHVRPFRERYTAALLRHWYAHLGGEFYDGESHLPHLAHAYACAIFLAEGPVDNG